MNNLYTDATQLARLHDAALERARQLRSEAMADFWRGANGMLGHAALAAQRAATRLAYRLAHRLQRRAAGRQGVRSALPPGFV